MSKKDEKNQDDGLQKVEVPVGHEIEGVVYYAVTVFHTSGEQWGVKKRYSQFEAFHARIVADHPKRLPVGAELPPKKFKLFSNHSSVAFIEERRVLLESYLNKILSVSKLAKSKLVEEFLSTDKTAAPEQKRAAMELPEDVEVTDIDIPAFKVMSDHILYQIDIANMRMRKSFQKWTMLKRFSQFAEMDALVRADFVDRADVLQEMPPAPKRHSKLMHDHMDEAFAHQRRVLLENYLNQMLRVIPVVRNKHFLSFLGVP